jgi:hypothetical protein
VAEGSLKVILQDYEPPPIPVHLVHAGQSILPLKLRRFTEFATVGLRKSLAADVAMLGASARRPSKK